MGTFAPVSAPPSPLFRAENAPFLLRLWETRRMGQRDRCQCTPYKTPRPFELLVLPASIPQAHPLHILPGDTPTPSPSSPRLQPFVKATLSNSLPPLATPSRPSVNPLRPKPPFPSTSHRKPAPLLNWCS